MSKEKIRLNVGWIGLGGRGSGAIRNIMKADTSVKIVAIADMWEEKVLQATKRFSKFKQFEVPQKNQFIGFDAYKKLCKLKEVDIVILTTPPAFRPVHIFESIKRKKHIFAEKPLAIDMPSLIKILDIVKTANKNGISFLSGFCWRYTDITREIKKAIIEKKIGEVKRVHSTYLTGGGDGILSNGEISLYKALKGKNWLQILELSGDSIVEQAIHSIDKLNWYLDDRDPFSLDTHPISCVANGSNYQRDEAKTNHFASFSVRYLYPNNKIGTMYSRQVSRCHDEVKDFVYGDKGVIQRLDGNIGKSFLLNNETITKGSLQKGYDIEHREFVGEIKAGKVFSDIVPAFTSTAMSIMGRIACYTGQTITWDQLLKSKEVIFDSEKVKNFESKYFKIHPLAKPGETKFI